MKVKAFLHSDAGSPNTISEINRIHKRVEARHFLGLYAYATQSGAALFDLELGNAFWEQTLSRWVFGIDYGRTQPQALRSIASKVNAEVRVYDGAWVVNQNGFMPRRDFHAKMAVMLDRKNELSGIVVGSGNFSSNGLRKSIEAGASIVKKTTEDSSKNLRSTLELAEDIWTQATPISDILDAYEERWSDSFSRKANESQPDEETGNAGKNIFWIEAGYITKNRGPHRPGNQIDFPKGMSRYFGITPPDNLAANMRIGCITFETPMGEKVSNNLRLGNNMMEKISLPIPERHGFDIYDGKILVFERAGDCFLIRALEADDFMAAFGDRLAEVRVMGSGRRYGHILDNV